MVVWADLCSVRPAVMGIINVTPDSFSDGGEFFTAATAIAHGLDLVAQGADILDVGGESTRPGSSSVDPAEQCRRVLPVISELAALTEVPISIDTQSSSVAAAAIAAGANIVNDVSAGRYDPEIMNVAAEAKVGYIVMHMQGEPLSMQAAPKYDDVVSEVIEFLGARVELAQQTGIARGALAVDPGIGFGKTAEHNFSLLAHLGQIGDELAAPVLVGTSRKRFLIQSGSPVGDSSGPGPVYRDDETLATVVWALNVGAKIVRVHSPLAAVRARALLEVMATA